MNEETKSKRAYMINPQTICVFYNGKPHTVAAQDAERYKNVKRAILDNDWDTVYAILDIKGKISDFASGKVSVEGNNVYYNDTEQLHGVVVDKLLEMIKAGAKDSTPLVKFIENLMENPSSESINELYNFLSYKSLPIDEDGYVIGYKGVQDNYYSSHGNKSTVVVQGKVNESGQILNTVGETIEVLRRCVDDNRKRDCSHGLHIGSFDYARGWGVRTMIVRFNPRDAVSVPERDCQKLRVCKYEVIGELERGYEQEIRVPVATADNTGVTITLNGREIPLA